MDFKIVVVSKRFLVKLSLLEVILCKPNFQTIDSLWCSLESKDFSSLYLRKVKFQVEKKEWNIKMVKIVSQKYDAQLITKGNFDARFSRKKKSSKFTSNSIRLNWIVCLFFSIKMKRNRQKWFITKTFLKINS